MATPPEEVITAVNRQGYWPGGTMPAQGRTPLSPVWLMVSGVKDEEEEISHFVCSFHDITQGERGRPPH